MDVSDRNLQPQLTQQAKMPTNLIISAGIFAFAGFVSGLGRLERKLQSPFLTPLRRKIPPIPQERRFFTSSYC